MTTPIKFFPIHTHLIPWSANVELVGCIQDCSHFEKHQRPGISYSTLEEALDLDPLPDLGDLYKKGLRCSQFAHWKNLPFYESNALTDLGHAFLQQMYSLDIMLDVTHLHATHPAIHAFQGTKIASHVVVSDLLEDENRPNAYSSDELLDIDAVLYGIPFVDDLVSPRAAQWIEDRDVCIMDIVNQTIRMIEIVGITKVAFGPDIFDCSIVKNCSVRHIPGMDNYDGLFNLRQLLHREGLSTSDLDLVFWKNAHRVFSK